MEDHLSSQSDEKFYTDNFCCDQKKNGQDLYGHKKSINLGKPLKYDFCDTFFPCGTTGVLKCFICNEMHEIHHNSYKALVYERQDEKSFECTICSYKANSRRALKRHRKTHIVSNTLAFECENENSLEYDIGYKVKSERDSKDHKTTSGRINTLINEKRMSDTYEKHCNGYNASTSELKDEKTFECTMCTYKSKDRKALQRHKKTHVISNTLAFEGEDERDLKEYQTKNGSTNTLLCEKKALETDEKRGNSYKASTYEGQDDKFFECTICSYKAKSRRALLRHRKTHIISNTLAFEGEDETTLEHYFGYKVKNKQALKDRKTKSNSTKLKLCANKDKKVNESVIEKNEAKDKPAKSKRKKNENTLRCKVCSYRTISKEGLVSHMKIHNSVDTLECKYCGFIYSATDLSERHECNRYLGSKRINFVNFQEKDVSTKYLEPNMGNHNVSAFKCKDLKHYLNQSLKRQSPKQKDMRKYKCTSYKYKDKSAEQLNSHMVKQSKNKKLKCDYCDYKCLKSEELELHLYTHKNVKCSQNELRNSKTLDDLSNRYRPNSEFGNKKRLASNELENRRCVLRSNYKYKSMNEICTSAENKITKTIEKPLLYFNSFTAVLGRKYIELRHSDRIFRCIFCSFTTSAKIYLKEHIIETHEKSKFLKCKFSSFKGTSKTCLKNHMKSQAIKKLSCEFRADVRFLPKGLQFNLNKSRSGSTHLQGKQSICKCNRTLTNNKENQYNKVKRIAGAKLNQHEEEKKFGCMLCDYYNSTTNKNMKSHVSVEHIDTQIIYFPFDCRYCNYKSATPDQREHSKVHSNGNAVRFRFKQRKYKNRGLRELRKRKDKPTFKCVFCGFCNYDSKNSFSDHAMIHVGQSFSYCSSS